MRSVGAITRPRFDTNGSYFLEGFFFPLSAVQRCPSVGSTGCVVIKIIKIIIIIWLYRVKMRFLSTTPW